jgi:PilZ domain
MSGYRGQERRKSPRAYRPLPVRVQGVDRSGQAFEADTLAENVSSGGFYLLLPQNVEEGAKLLTALRFAKAGSRQGPGLGVMACGIVVRAEYQHDGRYGLAVAIKHHRFL